MKYEFNISPVGGRNIFQTSINLKLHNYSSTYFNLRMETKKLKDVWALDRVFWATMYCTFCKSFIKFFFLLKNAWKPDPSHRNNNRRDSHQLSLCPCFSTVASNVNTAVFFLSVCTIFSVFGCGTTAHCLGFFSFCPPVMFTTENLQKLYL